MVCRSVPEERSLEFTVGNALHTSNIIDEAMHACIACAPACSKIWRLSARPPIGKPLPATVQPAPTVATRLFAAVASRVCSKPTAITRSRSHAATATVPPARRVIFPLDKQLALLPGRFTPLLQDQLAHLGVWMPFAKAVDLLATFTQTSASESTAQRLTEAIGLAYEAVQVTEAERIERDWPEVEEGPDKLIVSVDGAFVPVLHGEWAEVKTLVVGEVDQPSIFDGKTVVSTHNHSYFSRVAEAHRVLARFQLRWHWDAASATHACRSRFRN
jgi:hypothetical protein